MKGRLIIAICAGAMLLSLYLMISFYMASLNIATWYEGARFTFASFGLLISFVGILAFGDYKEKP